jgi:hypothetical protein
VSSEVSITVATDRTAIETVDSVRVTVTIVNRGSRTVETWDPRSYACISPYRVTDPGGAAVPLPGRFCLAIGYARKQLAPGDSVTILDRWRGDLQDAGGVKPAPPGRYQIAAHVFVENRELGSAPVEIQLIR